MTLEWHAHFSLISHAPSPHERKHQAYERKQQDGNRLISTVASCLAPSQELTEQHIDTYMHKFNVHVYVHVYVYVYVHVMCMCMCMCMRTRHILKQAEEHRPEEGSPEQAETHRPVKGERAANHLSCRHGKFSCRTIADALTEETG